MSLQSCLRKELHSLAHFRQSISRVRWPRWWSNTAEYSRKTIWQHANHPRKIQTITTSWTCCLIKCSSFGLTKSIQSCHCSRHTTSTLVLKCCSCLFRSSSKSRLKRKCKRQPRRSSSAATWSLFLLTSKQETRSLTFSKSFCMYSQPRRVMIPKKSTNTECSPLWSIWWKTFASLMSSGTWNPKHMSSPAKASFLNLKPCRC